MMFLQTLHDGLYYTRLLVNLYNPTTFRDNALVHYWITDLLFHVSAALAAWSMIPCLLLRSIRTGIICRFGRGVIVFF